MPETTISWHWIWTLCFLLSQCYHKTSADFDVTRNGVRFIFHDNTDLGLVMHGQACFFGLVPDYKEDVFSQSDQDLSELQDEVIRLVMQNSPAHIRPSSLAYMDSLYQDKDANARCAGKQVFSLAFDLCPKGWEGFGGACYLYVDDYVNRETAKHICMTKDGHLVEITSVGENSFVHGLQYHEEFWIGTNDKRQEGRWMTGQHGRGASFLPWAPHQPDDAYGAQDCVYLGGGGMWTDEFCTEEHPFVCEQFDQYQLDWTQTTSRPTVTPGVTSPQGSCSTDWCLVQNAKWENHIIG